MIPLQFFGVPLDPWDGEDRVSLKRAYISASIRGKPKFPQFRDPYDALVPSLKKIFKRAFFKGKISVDSWLWSTPEPEDLILVTSINNAVFIDTDGCREYSDKVRDFIQDENFQGIPVMIGIDHSSTGGAIEALTKKYGRENFSFIILDSHSDFLTMKHRYDLIQYQRERSGEKQSSLQIDPFSIPRPESYNSGSFLYHLINEGIIPADRVTLLGVSDYPPKALRGEDPRVERAISFYRKMEDNGLRVITKKSIEKNGISKISKLLRQGINQPNLYISIDIDIGAISAIYGAREIEEPPIIGLKTRQLYRIGMALAKIIRDQNVELLGLDLMETDVYKAGIPLKNGRIDRTYQVEVQLLKKILGSYI